MNFFSQIKGMVGENLSTAVLRFLLDRSPDIRAAVLDLLSSQPTARPILADFRFSSRTEDFTKDGPDITGRLDLLIETDDAVVGFENKFYADFTENQPKKYFAHIQNLAQKLSGVYGPTFRPFLVVLAPQSRIEDHDFQERAKLDIEEKDRDQVLLISWQTLLVEMEKARPADQVSSFLLEQLRQYVVESVGSLTRLPKMFVNLKRRPTSQNVTDQKEFVDWLWKYFVSPNWPPRGVRRNASAGNWVGHVCLKYETTKGLRVGWYGFYNTRLIEEFKDNAMESSELVLATNFDVTLGSEFRPLVGRIEWADPYTHFWILNFKNDWTEPQHWIQRLKPFHDEVGRQLASLE